MTMINPNAFRRVLLQGGIPLLPGQETKVSDKFLIGPAYKRIYADVAINYTQSSGTGAIAEALLRLIKQVNLTTSDGENISTKTPGRFLYRLNQWRNGGQGGRLDTFAATSGVYRTLVELPFDEPLVRPSERYRHILNSAFYKSLTFGLFLGNVNDLLASPSGDTFTATMDLYADVMDDLLPQAHWPKDYVQYGLAGQVQALSGQNYVELDKSANLGYKRIITGVMTSGASGVAFDGTPSDSAVSSYSIKPTGDYILQQVSWEGGKSLAMRDGNFPAPLSGLQFYDWIRGPRTLDAVYKMAGQTTFQVQTDVASTSNSPQLAVGFEGVRPLAKQH